MMKKHECLCGWCGTRFEDTIEGLDMCVDCENEFAEFLDSKGLVVGEFDDRTHPNFQPDALKGTRWEHGPTML